MLNEIKFVKDVEYAKEIIYNAKEFEILKDNNIVLRYRIKLDEKYNISYKDRKGRITVNSINKTISITVFEDHFSVDFSGMYPQNANVYIKNKQYMSEIHRLFKLLSL